MWFKPTSEEIENSKLLLELNIIMMAIPIIATTIYIISTILWFFGIHWMVTDYYLE